MYRLKPFNSNSPKKWHLDHLQSLRVVIEAVTVQRLQLDKSYIRSPEESLQVQELFATEIEHCTLSLYGFEFLLTHFKTLAQKRKLEELNVKKCHHINTSHLNTDEF